MTKIVNAIILIWFSSIIYAQDARFYQYEMNDLFLNPALTGDRLFEHKGLQINTNYHSNSSKNLINGDASALGLGMDVPLGDRFSIGQYFGNNRAFDGSFNTFNYMASVSYKILNSNMFDDKHLLSIGMQLGVVNNSLNTKRLYYESQYSPFSNLGFDQSIESGESFSQQSFYRLDNNIGVLYRFKTPSKKMIFTSGFSLYHLAKNNGNSQLGDINQLRTNVHFQLNYEINPKMGVTPHILYTNQGLTSDFNVGTFYHYNLHKDFSPIFGFNVISKKATVYQVGLKYKNSMYKISYAFANNRNTAFINDGLELAIVHTFSSKNQSNNLNSTNEDLNIKPKEVNPQNRLPATSENFYLLKLKLIVDRLDVLIKSKEISKSDIQSELNRIIVEIQELSKMTTNEKYLEVANQYKQLIADKLKLLESKIHQQ